MIENSVVSGDYTELLFEDCLSELELFSINQVKIAQPVIEKLMMGFKCLGAANLEYSSYNSLAIYRITTPMVRAISTNHLVEVNLDFNLISTPNLSSICLNNPRLQRFNCSGQIPSDMSFRHSIGTYSDLIEQLKSKKHLRTNLASYIETPTSINASKTNELISLDSDTGLPSQALRDVIEYIAPNPNGININPRDYRETPCHVTLAADGSLTIEEYIPTDISLYTSYTLVDEATPLKILYEDVAANDSSCYLAERQYILDNQWQGLTSCSPYEHLLYLQADALVEIGYSLQLKKYYVRLQASDDKKVVTVLHIFNVTLATRIQGKKSKEFSHDLIRCLVFSRRGGYKPHELRDYAVNWLTELSPHALAAELVGYYAGSPLIPDSGFKAGKLVGTFPHKDIKLINAIKFQKLGRCELRVIALYLDMFRLGLPNCIIWGNDPHAFLEVIIDGIVYHMDPGGFPLNLNPVTPSSRKMELDSDSDSELETERLVPQVSQKVQQRQKLDLQLELGEDNPFITWKKQASSAEQQFSIDDYVSQLMQKAGQLNNNRRNILVICEDSNQLELFNARLTRDICLKKQKKYYYLSSYDSYSPSSVRITEIGHEKIPSQLIEFATTCSEEDVLCVNISHVGAQYLWFIRLAEGNLDTYPLPQGLRLILVVDRESLANIGSELYRRMDLVEHMPSFTEGDLYNGCVHYYDAEDPSRNTHSAVRLYENANAAEVLKGEIKINADRLSLEDGPLIKAIGSDDEVPSLCIQNAPFQLRAFREFLINLCNSGRLYHNGTFYLLPQPFVIAHNNARYLITPLNAENTSLWDYPLNRATWSLFFKTYHCEPSSHQLHENLGLLAAHANGSLRILVTDVLSPNYWAEFVDAATQYNVALEFIVHEGISLPQAMCEQAQQEEEDEKEKERSSINSSIGLVVTNDVDFTYEHQLEHHENDVVYHITPTSRYSELFESISADSDTLQFRVHYGYLLQELLNGKRVILKGANV